MILNNFPGRFADGMRQPASAEFCSFVSIDFVQPLCRDRSSKITAQDRSGNLSLAAMIALASGAHFFLKCSLGLEVSSHAVSVYVSSPSVWGIQFGLQVGATRSFETEFDRFQSFPSCSVEKGASI